MTTRRYDPAKTPGSPEYTPDPLYNLIDGPGGSTILSDNDEKGILESSIQPFVDSRREAELGSDHDPYREGVYATNSVGDND